MQLYVIIFSSPCKNANGISLTRGKGIKFMPNFRKSLENNVSHGSERARDDRVPIELSGETKTGADTAHNL